MKYIIPILILVFTGCATTTYPEASKWKAVENLVGEPLVEKLIELGDAELAELAERRRNVRLEVASTHAKGKSSEEAAREEAIQKAINAELSRHLKERAMERKMELWRLNNKTEKGA
jgi:hypothetical protein